MTKTIEIDLNDTEQLFEALAESTDETYITEDLESVVEERLAALYSNRDMVEEQYEQD